MGLNRTGAGQPYLLRLVPWYRRMRKSDSGRIFIFYSFLYFPSRNECFLFKKNKFFTKHTTFLVSGPFSRTYGAVSASVPYPFYYA